MVMLRFSEVRITRTRWGEHWRVATEAARQAELQAGEAVVIGTRRDALVERFQARAPHAGLRPDDPDAIARSISGGAGRFPSGPRESRIVNSLTAPW